MHLLAFLISKLSFVCRKRVLTSVWWNTEVFVTVKNIYYHPYPTHMTVIPKLSHDTWHFLWKWLKNYWAAYLGSILGIIASCSLPRKQFLCRKTWWAAFLCILDIIVSNHLVSSLSKQSFFLQSYCTVYCLARWLWRTFHYHWQFTPF